MPVSEVVPFELDAVSDAVRLLTAHRAKGQIVIAFGSSKLEYGIMGIEKVAANFFQMSDAVWERHANPWSVWTMVWLYQDLSSGEGEYSSWLY